MKKFYFSACTVCTILGLSAQEILWQKDIRSSTQDFLRQITTTIMMLYGMSRRQLLNLKTKNRVRKINTLALVQGVYLVAIKTDNNKTANVKLVKK